MGKRWPKAPDRLKPSDTAQLAIWISDDDPPAKLAWWQHEEAPRRFEEAAAVAGLKLGKPRWYTLQPGEGQAGTPPDGVQGTNVRLWVAEAEVKGVRPQIVPKSFIADLDPKDLEWLRAVTARAALPTVISVEEADAVIEAHGPKLIERIIKERVDAQS